MSGMGVGVGVGVSMIALFFLLIGVHNRLLFVYSLTIQHR